VTDVYCPTCARAIGCPPPDKGWTVRMKHGVEDGRTVHTVWYERTWFT